MRGVGSVIVNHEGRSPLGDDDSSRLAENSLLHLNARPPDPNHATAHMNPVRKNHGPLEVARGIRENRAELPLLHQLGEPQPRGISNPGGLEPPEIVRVVDVLISIHLTPVDHDRGDHRETFELAGDVEVHQGFSRARRVLRRAIQNRYNPVIVTNCEAQRPVHVDRGLKRRLGRIDLPARKKLNALILGTMPSNNSARGHAPPSGDPPCPPPAKPSSNSPSEE